MSRKTQLKTEAVSQAPATEDDDVLLGGAEEDAGAESVDVYGSDLDEVDLDGNADAENSDVENTELGADEEVSLSDAEGEEGAADPASLVDQIEGLLDQLKSAVGGGDELGGDMDGDLESPSVGADGDVPEFDLDADEDEDQPPVVREETAPTPPTSKVPGQSISKNTEFAKPSTSNTPKASLPKGKGTQNDAVVDMSKVYALLKAAAHAVKSKANLPDGKGPNGSKPDSVQKTDESDPLKPLKARKVAEFKIHEGLDKAIEKMMNRDTDNLSEGFKKDAADLMRAAVTEHVEKAMDALDKIYVPTIVETYKKKEARLVAKLDEYLDYVVENFMTENKIAIEEGLDRDISESFMLGLKGLFESHHVSMPEGKEDLVKKLHADLTEVTAAKSEVTRKAIALKKENIRLVRESVIDAASHGLSMNEKAKLAKLAEGVEFSNRTQFAERVGSLVENNFNNKDPKPATKLTESVETLVETTLPTQGKTDLMDQYLGAIKKKK